jgi:hypothetical protein
MEIVLTMLETTILIYWVKVTSYILNHKKITSSNAILEDSIYLNETYAISVELGCNAMK